MEKSKRYKSTFFKVNVLKRASDAFDKLCEDAKTKSVSGTLGIGRGDVDWTFGHIEEFLAEYSSELDVARFSRLAMTAERSLAMERSFDLRWYCPDTTVYVKAPTRAEIEQMFNILEEDVEDSRITTPPKIVERPRIFIGHGQSEQWRDLKDHLHEKHGCDVEAYEIGARAGHAIRDILEDMLKKSSFALLVMTAEDETADGRHLARQNVIHEIGLFEGKLGFSRAIVLLEEGTEEFSNIHGLQQIRYSKGRIRETFGEVLAVLRREFSSEG